MGASWNNLDAQAEYIIERLTSNFKVIWLVGHHHRVDPRADGNYLLPYEWREDDIWSDHKNTLVQKNYPYGSGISVVQHLQ